jgi:glutaredoxin
MKNSITIFWVVIVAVIALLVGVSFFSSTGPGQYDTFAQCLKDKGVIMYGAFWCPHCQRTKAMFGASSKYLPYVECSSPDGQSQLQVCKDKGIQSYPTWTFPGTTTTLTGEHTLQEIAALSSCALSK